MYDAVRTDIGDIANYNSKMKDGGYCEDYFRQVKVKYGRDRELSIGDGEAIDIEYPLQYSRDVIHRLAAMELMFYRLRKYGNLGMYLYYTQLLHGIQYDIDWIVWSEKIKVGIDSLETELELLEDTNSALITDWLFDCLIGLLDYEGDIGWQYMHLSPTTQTVCEICIGCIPTYNLLMNKWRELLNVSGIGGDSYGYSIPEIDWAREYLLTHVSEWFELYENLTNCMTNICGYDLSL